MRLVVNLALVALIVLLGYMLVHSIEEPIKFKAEKDRRENAVVDKLLEIRKMQEFYRDITVGSFAPTFDTLKEVLTTGKFMEIKAFGDPDDPNNTEAVSYDTTYTAAIDTIIAMGINLDSLSYVPFSNGAQFKMVADTLTYQSTLVNVVQVNTPRSVFMGPFSDPRFAQYDNSYNPNSLIGFGDLTKPNLSGNWER